MTPRLSLALSLVGLVSLVATPAVRAADAPTDIRRFALIAGANDGGEGRVPLRYATTDAEAMAEVLEELGGVTAEDRTLLRNPTRKDFENAVVKLGKKLKRAKAPHRRLEVLLYYSGHSDEDGILLGGERIDYPEVRRLLDSLDADVRIAVLDSCASGALTRLKGGTMRPPFLVDASGDVRGHAFLTSSSANESAQESDRVGGSFFTHFLVSGLRGAADSTGDGRVTLTEAYQFAFDETLARTERTQGGPQHPHYDIHLSGSGDLVMTDLRATSAGLGIAKDVGGRLFVRDAEGHLVVELRKPQGREVELGLAPGRYRVTLDREEAAELAEVTLQEGSRVELGSDAFARVDREAVAMRGDAAAPPTTVSEEAYQRVPFAVSVVPGAPPYGLDGRKVIKDTSFNLLIGKTDRLRGVELSGIGSLTSERVEGAQLAGVFNINRGELRGMQAAGVFNISGSGQGVQLAGVGNYLGGTGAGRFQAAGVINVSGAGQGAQVAGVGNFLGPNGSARFQAAGVVNQAPVLQGVQVALVNIGGSVQGAQIGLVNIASRSARGAQIGLVNIADHYERGVPVGLVNVVKDGMHHAEIWGSTLVPAGTSLRFGSRHMYTLVSLGADELGEQTSGRLYGGFGLGVSSDTRERLFVAFDVTAFDSIFVTETSQNNVVVRAEPEFLLTQARLQLGVRIWGRLGLFVGATLDGYVGLEPGATGEAWKQPTELVVHQNDRAVRLWPGAVFGLQL